VFALATVSVGLVACVSTQLPSFDAWIVNASIVPQSMFEGIFAIGQVKCEDPKII
jgi:hypothetical protein